MATPIFSATLEEQKNQLDDTSAYVQKRYVQMITSKVDYNQRMDAVWELFDEPSNWLMYADYYNTPIRTNTLRDTVNAVTDMFMKNPPEAIMEAAHKQFEYGAIGLKAYVDGIKESIHEKKVRRKVIHDMFVRGNGFRGVMYHSMSKQLGGEKVSVFDDLCTYRIDPRNFFIDENAYQLHDALRLEQARDIIHKRFFDFDTFKMYFSQLPGVKNLDKIQAQNFFNDILGTNYYTYNYKETTEKSIALGVHVYEYMNQVDNTYIIVANNTTIFEGTLTDCKGTDRLPIIHYQFEPRLDSAWGKSLGELLAPYIYMEDTLLNLELMNIKLTLQPVLAVSGDFGFNPRIHVVQPGGVWTAGGNFSGKVADSIHPIVSGNAQTNFYNMQNLLQNKMVLTSRTDLRNLEDAPDTTATQVLAQQRSFNAHNERIESINEIEAEGVMTEIMLDVVRSYMNTQDDEGNKKRVKVKGYIVRQHEGAEPTFISRSGEEDYFDMSQGVIDAEVKVVIKDKRSEVADNVEKVGRMMQYIPVLSQLMQIHPELAQQVKIEYINECMMEYLGLDTSKALQQDADDMVDQFSLLKQEIIFGHNIDVPAEESREDSMRRVKFLTQWRVTKQFADMVENDQVALRAWEYHFDSAMHNINANHMVGQEEPGEQQMPGQPPMPGQPGQPTMPQVPQNTESLQAPGVGVSNLLPQ